MTTEISGTVEDTNGNLIDGATIFIIRESDDTVVDTTTTDSAGEYQVTGLNDTETYHVAAQYDDGSTKYSGESYPAVSPFTDTGPIDDFENSDIVEYEGDKISFDTQTSEVYEGSVALEMGNDDGTDHAIRSFSGLPRYPSSGDEFQFRIYFENSDSSAEMHFGVSDSDNYYRAKLSPSVGEISLGKRVSGSLNNLETAFGTIPTGEWIRGTIEWTTDPELRFTLYDASGSEITQTDFVADSEFASGGIGWNGFVDSFSGDSIYYDIAELTSVGGTTSVVIDNFDDGDMKNYQLLEVAAGETIETVTSTVKAGSHSLKIYCNQGSSFPPVASSTAGLDTYPGQGDSFEVYFYQPQDGTNFRLYWCVQDESNPTDNSYRLKYDHAKSPHLVLEKRGSGGEVLDLDPIAYRPTGVWLRFRITHASDGTISAELLDENGIRKAAVQGTDTSYTSGGIAWSYLNSNSGPNNGDGPIYIDEAEVVSTDVTGVSPHETAGMVAWWPLVAGFGNSVSDETFSGSFATTTEYDGDFNSNASWSTDAKNGYSVELNNGSLTFPDGNFTEQDSTIAFWVKFDSLPSSGGADNLFIAQYDGSVHPPHVKYDNNALSNGEGLIYRMYDGPNNVGNYIGPTKSLNTGTWYHIAYTLDWSTGDAEIFIDGQSEASGQLSGLNTNSEGYKMGTLTGHVDDIRAYNVIKSQSEIQAIMNEYA
jgi:hypothetical protein